MIEGYKNITTMAFDIKKQIENIDKSLRWIKEYRPEHYNQRFLQLVEERRKLRILDNAERNNPGIAAFGQSQVGKSYLMNCILQDGQTAFLVSSPEGEHNFVNEINPIGNGAEATGVVTRFSAYNRHPEYYCDKFPIRMRVLNVRDILMILCDSYFKQFNDYTVEGENEIVNFCNHITDTYSLRSEIDSPALIADDLLDMKLYFKQHINEAQVFSGRSAFFDRLALVITKVPITDYVNVFSILWHNDYEFTRLFKTCLNILQKLQFSEYVYLPINAVLHKGVKQDTIMSVSCLEMLFSEASKGILTDVYLKEDDSFKKLEIFTKSEICAVCSEVIIKINERFISSTAQYDMRNIRDDCRELLPSGTITMSVLNDADLLDFPGARAPEQGTISKLVGNTQTLMYSFLRGKVDYLFNKYNEEQTINILLYCHNQKNNDATQMRHLLERWVNDYVGNTPEKRAEFIRRSVVSPLFHIGTMWNVDLEESPNSIVGNSPQSVLNRWKGRFEDLLLGKCFHQQDVDWVSNWDGEGKPFQNCYMLRDFEWSKKIYDGFEKTGKEQSMLIEENYYNTMRETFIQSNETTHLFKNAALAWDTSASIGNDGSLYIIQQLSMVAAKIQSAREIQIEQRLETIAKTILSIMKEYFVSDDTTEILSENIRKANGIFRELEFACQDCPEYFGNLLKSLQLTEAESFKEVHRLIPELGRTINNTDKILDYELIRKRCNNFEDCKSEDEMWKVFIKSYRFANQDEASDFLKSKNIDSHKLFKGETLQRKNSSIISDDIVNLWQENISGVQFMNNHSGLDKVDEIVLTSLVECISSTAQSVNLVGRIENEIADYVDILNTSNINEDLVADMIATKISDFVIDFGYKYLQGEQIESSKRIAKEQNLPCYIWTEQKRKEHFDEEEMTCLFNDILSSCGRYTPAYEANYNTWLEYMYIAFIAHINVPNYDRDANDKLKVILDSIKNS